MNAQSLIARMREQRQSTVELGDGLSVTIIRPCEADIRAFSGASRPSDLDVARKYVVGWKGFTEATLLGEAVGASDEVPFSQEVWTEAVADRLDWVHKVVIAVVSSIHSHQLSVAGEEKN